MWRAFGEVPRLGVAVALLVAVAAVQVGDDRHWAAVWTVVGAVPVAPADPTGRVRPVERLVDQEQVRPEAAVRPHELVDPLDPHGLAPRRLDRERRIVERLRVVDRAVAPHFGRAETHRRREDLLPELANADSVVIDRPALLAAQLAAARHRRRDHQRGRVLWDRQASSTLVPSGCARPAADESPLTRPAPAPAPACAGRRRVIGAATGGRFRR